MKAFSVRAPWWWWIIHGGKDIENRSARTSHRGPVLIHASLWWKQAEVIEANEFAAGMYQQRPELYRGVPGMSFNEMMRLGGHIVGIADLVDCVTTSDSPWFMPAEEGEKPTIGWKLENMRPVKNPIKVKGALGVFDVPFIDTIIHPVTNIVTLERTNDDGRIG